MEEKPPVTGTVYLETTSFESGPSDDADARDAFIEAHKLTKAQAETIVMTDKEHVIGSGITYTFSAEGK